MKLSRLAIAAYVLAAAIVVVDQLTKSWILDGLQLPLYGSVAVFGPLNFTLTHNQGVSFGLLQAQHDIARWALVIFSVIVAGVLAVWVRKSVRWAAAIGFGLVIGGAVGNAIDRARFGFVIDFIDVQKIGFFPWIFNVADSAITIGVVFLLIDSVRPQGQSQKIG
jgi:signal peptidase II